MQYKKAKKKVKKEEKQIVQRYYLLSLYDVACLSKPGCRMFI